MKLPAACQKFKFQDQIFPLLALGYLGLFLHSVWGLWFNPLMTTDDARQQIFPFHVLNHPGIFEGDLIYETMKGYLAPLHYGLGYLITLATGDPIMTGHWMMLIQLSLCLLGIFGCIYRMCDNPAPAWLGVAWFLHSRHLLQRLTAGLPRGWSAPLISLFLYFLVSGNHSAVLLTILAGCLLNPPATVVIALCYGIYLTVMYTRPTSRAKFQRPFIIFLLSCPLFLALTLWVVHRPPEVGQMVTYTQALKMPEFKDPGGRFAFLPFKPISDEIHEFGFQVFISRWFDPGAWVKNNIEIIIASILIMLASALTVKRKPALPLILSCYLISVLVVYGTSRALAFWLYVPNRHLQIPLGIFFICALPTMIWQALESAKKQTLSKIGLLTLALLILACSGSGLRGVANFNLPLSSKPSVFSWIGSNTPPHALIAGQPDVVDAVPLLSVRRVYAATEFAHPFYQGYYAEIKRRLIKTWEAYYAKDLKTLVEVLEPEGVDYFVFRRSDFYPEALAKASYFLPLDSLVRELASVQSEDYAYKKLPSEVDLERFPFMPYRSREYVVIDVAKLRAFLAS